MKMLVIVFRDGLEQDILRVLKGLGVKAFTQTPKVLGTGEAGQVFDSFDWPGTNSMIFAALEDDHALRVVEGMKAFRNQMAQKQHGAKIPMRVFVLPCELVV